MINSIGTYKITNYAKFRPLFAKPLVSVGKHWWNKWLCHDFIIYI